MSAALQLVQEGTRVPRLKTVSVADLFCGAGGSSTGAQRALRSLGIEMQLVAVNHWPVAIETHSKNHPNAVHYCQDLATLRPREAVASGRLELLMASPTCTHHSRARGGRPTSDQQRMDPWHVVTWLTELRVKRLLIENVPEYMDWGPVDERSGKPIKSRKGEYFQTWVTALRGLGFKVDWRVLCAADYGDATTRERFFLIGRSDGKQIRWPRPTHSRKVDGPAFLPGIASTTKRWRAAREIIDWEVKGRSIFGRKKPLSPKTLARIYAGAVKFKWPRVFLVLLEEHQKSPAKSLAELMQVDRVSEAIREHRGEQVEPFVLNRHGDNGAEARASSVEDPAPTATTRGAGYIVEPMILPHHRGGSVPRTLDQPIPTITGGEPGYLVAPFLLSQGAGGAPRAATEPVPTIPGGGAHALVEPMVASYYGNSDTCGTVQDPLPTVTTKERFGLVVPVTHTKSGPGGAQSLEEPIRTITTAKGSELAFITASFGEREGQAPRVHSVDAPAPTIPAKGSVRLVQAGDFDILFRMLEPAELAGAMGFSKDEVRYEFTGTKTEVIKQIGNAVAVGQAEALVRALFSEGR